MLEGNNQIIFFLLQKSGESDYTCLLVISIQMQMLLKFMNNKLEFQTLTVFFQRTTTRKC